MTNCFKKPRILVSLNARRGQGFLPQDLMDRLQRMASEMVVFDPYCNPIERWKELLHEFRPDILVTGWDTYPLPQDLPESLRYICHLCGEVRWIINREMIERGMLVTNWGASISRTIAECTMMLTLCAMRRVTYYALGMHLEGKWEPALLPSSLFEKRIGIHGFGNIARCFTRLIAPFRCSVRTYDPYVSDEVLLAHGVQRVGSLEELFSDSDVLVELAAFTAETTGVVTEALLRRLPPGAVFVNTGRPGVVDGDALLKVAREGTLQIGLDVYHQEPLPAVHPLRGLRNVTLLPHISGPTADHLRACGELALRNIARFIMGDPLESLITLDVYDRIT